MASLHTDLQEIREKSGQSVVEINSRTKTPVSVIQEIEKGVFFEKGDKQKTYIRSFVRTYAKAIGIKDEDIIRALDAQEAGTYAGGLRKKYLPETIQGDLEDPDATSTESQNNDVAKDDEDTGLVRPGPTSTIGHDEFSRPDPSRHHNRVTPPPPKMDAVDWAKFNESLTAFNAPILKYLSVAVVVVLLGAGGYYGFTLLGDFEFGGSDEVSVADAMQTTPEADILIESDSLLTAIGADSLSVIPPEIPSSLDPATLPDTLFLIVYAQNGKLEPVRVTSDVNSIRSPYWIEQNEAMRFDFFEQVTVEGALDRATFMINGHLIADIDSVMQNNTSIRFTRDFLSRRPYIFDGSQPELPVGFTQPSVIRDRPVF
jgi:hypothetical protein